MRSFFSGTKWNGVFPLMMSIVAKQRVMMAGLVREQSVSSVQSVVIYSFSFLPFLSMLNYFIFSFFHFFIVSRLPLYPKSGLSDRLLRPISASARSDLGDALLQSVRFSVGLVE